MVNSVTLAPYGDLIGDEVEKFKEKMVKALETEVEGLVVDMSGVNVIDSSGIGVLVASKNSVLANKGYITLKGVNSDIMKMFKIMRLTEHFNFID